MAVKCYINKIEYPLVGAVEITDHAAATSESTITVDIDGLPEPQAFDAVYLFEDENLLFGGVCSIPNSPRWDSVHTPQLYELAISGMNNLLTRRYVNKAWKATIYDIVMEIYEKIIKTENISLGTVSWSLSELPKQTYIAPDMTAYDALNELAGLVGAVWNIEINRASTLGEYLGGSNNPLVFYAGSSGPLPAITPYGFYDTPTFKPFRFIFLLREDFPKFMPTKKICSMQKKIESYDVRTVQIVKGASGITDPQTETFRYSAGQESISTTWPIVELPTITVNGTPTSVGVKGLDNDDSKQFLFSYNSNEIEINPDFPPRLSSNDLISVTYKGFFELRARMENQQTIAQTKLKSNTSGIIEMIEENERFTTAAELYAYTTNKLYQKAQAESEITMMVNSPEGTEPFTIWLISAPRERISGEFVVVEKVTTLEPNYRSIQLTLKDKGFLTAYGTIFYQKYKNNPVGIRETDIVISANNVVDTLNISCAVRATHPLCCFAGDEQPWLLGGDFYASY